MRPGSVSTFASLTERNYRLFFIGQTFNVVGSWMQKLALAWLVLGLTDSGAWLGLTVAAQQLPTMLLSPWAGVLADRRPKRLILLWAAGLGIIPATVMCALSFGDAVTLPLVIGLALISGCAEAVEKPARHAFPSELVETRLVTNAVVLNNVVQDTGKAVGPALAAILIGTAGISFAFLANALSFAPVLIGLLLMDAEALRTPTAVPRAARQVREGLRYVSSNPHLLGPLVLLVTAGVLAYNFQVVLPLLAREAFDGGAGAAGALLSALGIGSILGGLGTAGVLRPTPLRIVCSALAMGLLFLVVAASPTFIVALVVVLLVGASSVVFRTLASSWLQLTAEPAMRGRVLSLLVLSIAGTTPVGGPLVGWLAEQYGIRAAFIVAGAGVSLAALGVWRYLATRPEVGGEDVAPGAVPT